MGPTDWVSKCVVKRTNMTRFVKEFLSERISGGFVLVQLAELKGHESNGGKDSI